MFDEILRALKKHRILLIVTIFVCILSFSARAFAEESVNDDDDSIADIIDDSLPMPPLTEDLPNCLVYCYNGNYRAFVLNDDINAVSLVDAFSYDDNKWAPAIQICGAHVRYTLTDGVWEVTSDYSTKTNTSPLNYRFASYLGVSVDTFLEEADFEIVYSDFSVWNDNTETVFFSPTSNNLKLFSGNASQDLVEMTTREMVGLVPLAIGFLTLVLVFWKAWAMLRQALRMA